MKLNNWRIIFWVLPEGLEPFYLPPFLSAGLLGESTTNKKINTLCALRASAVKKVTVFMNKST